MADRQWELEVIYENKELCFGWDEVREVESGRDMVKETYWRVGGVRRTTYKCCWVDEG